MCSARLNFHPPARSPFATPPPGHPSPQRCHPERSEGSRSPTRQPSHPSPTTLPPGHPERSEGSRSPTFPPGHSLPSANAVILSAAKDLAAPRPSPVRSLHFTPHGDRTSPLLKLDGLCLIRYNTLMFN